MLKNPILFNKYFSPLASHRIGLVFKIYVWISVLRRKKWFVDPSHGKHPVPTLHLGAPIDFWLNSTLFVVQQLSLLQKLASGSLSTLVLLHKINDVVFEASWDAALDKISLGYEKKNHPRLNSMTFDGIRPLMEHNL